MGKNEDIQLPDLSELESPKANSGRDLQKYFQNRSFGKRNESGYNSSNDGEFRGRIRSQILNDFNTKDWNGEEIIQTGPEFLKFQKSQYENVVISNTEVQINPFVNFEDLALNMELERNVLHAYSDGPTAVQSYALPYVMHVNDVDILIRSHTGSGKTATFLIPMIQKIIEQKSHMEKKGTKPKKMAPFAVIVVPTKELAIQVAKEATKLAERTSVSVNFLIGKIGIRDSILNMRRGCDIVVGTIGRLEHFFFKTGDEEENAILDKSQVMYFVIDEADRLLNDDANRQTIDKFKVAFEGNKYQTILNSATICEDEYDETLLFNPISISVGHTLPVDTVVQRFINVDRTRPANVPDEFRAEAPFVWKCHKFDFLLHVLQKTSKPKPKKTIIFVNTKRKSDRVCIALLEAGYKALSINGDHNINHRQRSVDQFVKGRVNILVGTDVLARGINVPDVNLVINYDLPTMRIEEYVHRVGRTGRMGNVGMAISFFDPQTDDSIASTVEKIMLNTGQEVPSYLNDTIQSQFYDALELMKCIENRECIQRDGVAPWQKIAQGIEFI